MSKRYQSDLNDKQWAIIQPLMPAEKDGDRPRTTDMREVMSAVFYLLQTGCQWDCLSKCFPTKSTVYDYFSQWRDDGVLDDMVRELLEEIRTAAGRNPKPCDDYGRIFYWPMFSDGLSNSIGILCFQAGNKITIFLGLNLEHPNV